MLHRKFSICLLCLSLTLLSLNSQAQLKELWNKAKEKTEKTVDQLTTKKNSQRIEEVQAADDFMTGDIPLFSEDFSAYRAGSSVSSIKSNGLAAVSILKGYPGKWMILEDKATYKLSKALSLPDHFTVTFDLLAAGDQIKDIAPLSFGFAPDNSTKEYLGISGAYVELQYYDGDMVNTGSKNPEKYANHTFDLEPYLNKILHVSLEVKGERMTVYLNNRKLADGIFFAPSAAKHFYLSAPWEYHNGAKVFMANIKISGFSK